jgi:glutathionylspermidine synthase
VICDPFVRGEARFDPAPSVHPRAVLDSASDVAERIARVYDELVHVVHREPELARTFFSLSPCQLAMWQLSSPMWHVFGRVDLFDTPAGWMVTEMNSDTPTGHAEAVAAGALALARARARDPATAWFDPNEALMARFVSIVCAYAHAVTGPNFARTLGIVYPTDVTEDLPLVRLYKASFESAGFEVTLGSPFNVSLDAEHRLSLFGRPCAVVLRHYKTDWWGEREPVWSDAAPFVDALPLRRELHALAAAEAHRRAAIVNPFGSVLTQNKRAMAFMWEHKHSFSSDAQRTIEKHVPYTIRLESAGRHRVAVERTEWVLKSDYGCEGEEVLVGDGLTAAEWATALRMAADGHWIVQRRFSATVQDDGTVENLGVYVLGGQAAGFYARRERRAADRLAKSVALLGEP